MSYFGGYCISDRLTWSEKYIIKPGSHKAQMVMDRMFVSPSNSCVEILIPNVMILGGGAFGR